MKIRPPVLVAVAVGIALLAVVETTVALVAPSLAPTDADWTAAAAVVRAGFRPGDLIVAAPAWADPILRVQLGDLMPPEMLGRLDDDRFGRVWEVGQRGAHAPAAARGTATRDERFGHLRVRLVERPAENVRYDFVARSTDAHVRLSTAAGGSVDCRSMGDHVQCPAAGVGLHRQIVEVAQTLRAALLTEPVAGAAVVVEFPAVPLGQVLVVATGLHDTWLRKAARGTVEARVIVGHDPPVVLPTTTDDSGWTRTRLDTAAHAGQTLPVRFEITSAAPFDRAFAFAAEARQ